MYDCFILYSPRSGKIDFEIHTIAVKAYKERSPVSHNLTGDHLFQQKGDMPYGQIQIQIGTSLSCRGVP